MLLDTRPTVVPIKEIRQENAQVKTFIFDLSVGAKPGQFVNVWIPRVNEKPFSVALDDGRELHLAIAAVGPFSNAMHELKVGDKVGIRGPFGTTFKYNPGQHLALHGGGYGAAPLSFLAREAITEGCTVEFIVGARNKDLLLYIDRWQDNPKVKVHVSTDDGSFGHKGFNTELLEQVLAAGGIDCVYTVGPEKMMARAADLAEKYKVNAQISVERYMKCGFGVCGNCVVDGLGIPTCVYGPVMDLAEVRKILDFSKYHRDDLGKKHYL